MVQERWNWLWAVAAIGGALLAHGARAQAATPYEVFTELLAKNPATGRPVQDLAELVPLLSEDLRSNFTFVYESRSPHGGLGSPEASSVDALHPRAVLFTPDGKLALAFTGNPSKPGYNVVEAIHFNEAKAAFELSRFVLPAAGGDKDNGTLNPPSCLRCHGQDPRPITDSYPLWPGFYGSVRDTFPKGSKELPWYRRFLKESAGKVPYKDLRFPKGTSVPPYLDPAKYNPNTVEADFDELKLLPNTRLGMAWTELNRKRLQRKIAASPVYRRYRADLAAGLLGCKSFDLPVEAGEHVYSELYYENLDRLQRLGYHPRGPGKSALDMMELGMYENVAQIRYLAQVLGLDASDWSLAFESDSLSFFDGILSGMDGKDSYYLKEDFALELLQDIARDEKAVAPFVKTYGTYAQYGYPFGTRLDLPTARRACDALARAGQTVLPAWKPPAAKAAPTAQALVTRLALTEVPFARCTKCHEASGAPMTGHKIPFSDPARLAVALRKNGKSGRPLREEIEARVEKHGEGQMPPRGDRLSAPEIAGLKAYLAAVEDSAIDFKE